MNKTGKKRPLKECLGENSNELRHKRRRLDNIVLLRERDGGQNDDLIQSRYYEEGELTNVPPRRVLRAGGKRKRTTEVDDGHLKALSKQTEKPPDENDIINELTKEFKKARLRPVFFTISSFIEQTVDEVGFTMADEPETEVTVSLALPKKEDSEVEGTISISVAVYNASTVGNDTNLSMSSDLVAVEADNNNYLTGSGDESGINIKRDGMEEKTGSSFKFSTSTDTPEGDQGI